MIDLITFILFVTVSSFIINGWHEVTRNGRIFGFWERFWEHYDQPNDTDAPKYRFPEWVRNPISSCIICQASIFGTIIFGITFYFQRYKYFSGYPIAQIIFIYIAYLLCLTVTNYIVHKKLK